ncbi:MAG: M28 family peptidase [Ignavibacteriaceae bacterium]
MKLIFFVACLLTTILFSQSKNPEITAEEIYNHIKFLASDDLNGRLTGTEDIRIAAEYLKEEFESYGLTPAFNNSFFQPVKFNSSVGLGNTNSMSLYINDEEIELDVEDDFLPLPFSGCKTLTKGIMVFAGFGISDPKNNYDDYAGLDVKDKIVIIFRQYPDFSNPKTTFANFRSLRQKAKTAKDNGAAGLIIVNGYEEGLPSAQSDEFVNFIYDKAPLMNDFPVIQIKRKQVEELFAKKGNSLENLFQIINTTGQPHSVELKDATVSLTSHVYIVEGECQNVGAILEGNDPLLKNEYIVIGAHYDHLGRSNEFSLSRESIPQIHNGADDNASGTVGLLEIAEKLASVKDQLKRSFLFVAFTGEEMGLLGSAYIANNPPVSTDKMVTMINMDMIGRMDSSKSLILYGMGTSQKWNDLVNKLNPGFHLTLNPDGFGPSDQSSFYGKNIPVLFFFTGVHSDYHKPSDDFDRINCEGEKEILDFVYTIAYEINALDSKPDFVSVPRKEMSSTSGWRAYVGTVPDFGSNEEGYKISAITEGSPASKGGMLAGDLMIRFGGKSVTNIYDYTSALQEHGPGDEVEVVVKRNNKEIKLKIILGMR